MYRWMLAAALALGLSGQAAAQSTPEGVIGAQIDAFLEDDFAAAFDYASPGIRQMFQTPENFGRMVQQGYPMVWRPAEVRYGRSEDRGGMLLQEVIVTDASGRVFTLLYRMQRAGETWKIAGVQIVEAAQVGA
jgi:hypothetical protein